MYYDYLYHKLNNENGESNILLDIINQNIDMMQPNEHLYLKEVVNNLPQKIETISDYLYLANVSVAVQETLYFKLKQIDRDEYNWINNAMLDKCWKRLDDYIGCSLDANVYIEETIIHNGDDNSHKLIDQCLSEYFGNDRQFRFTARVDLITHDTVWELKCTSKISLDHLLQVVIYAWLWKMRYVTDVDEMDMEKKFKIFNIRTKELLSLNATLDDLNTIIVALLRGKFEKQEMKSDEDFIGDCANYLTSSHSQKITE
jgi:hypothetical protein